jgi:hypothetical protein
LNPVYRDDSRDERGDASIRGCPQAADASCDSLQPAPKLFFARGRGLGMQGGCVLA